MTSYEKGHVYLLKDRKGLFLSKEPAVYLGKLDSTESMPSICAMCGKPLLNEKYHTFRLSIGDGKHCDMMIGHGCIRDRVDAEIIDCAVTSVNDVMVELCKKFPDSGSWYGTFLHHHIAKQYVRDQNVVNNWSKEVLDLPGVMFIVETVDCLINKGYKLSPEKQLESGIADLVCIREDKVLVIDWKTDLFLDKHEVYEEQVTNYIMELCEIYDHIPVKGYISYVREEKNEVVRLLPTDNWIGVPNGYLRTYDDDSVVLVKELRKCKLNIDMDGGEGIDRKSRTEKEKLEEYGTEVVFGFSGFEPEKEGYRFVNFECSPYRAGELNQFLDLSQVRSGFPLRFITGKKRHNFFMKSNWERTKTPLPYWIKLNFYHKNRPHGSTGYLRSLSEFNDDGSEIIRLKLKDIVSKFPDCEIDRVVVDSKQLLDKEKNEWTMSDFKNSAEILLLCNEGIEEFDISIYDSKKKLEQNSRNNLKKENISNCDKTSENHLTTGDSGLISEYRLGVLDKFTNPETISSDSINSMVKSEKETNSLFDALYSMHIGYETYTKYNSEFTENKVYYAGKNRFLILYRSEESRKYGAHARVKVVKVEKSGKIPSEPRWMNVYRTRKGTEYIYDPTDENIKIYATSLSKY